MERIAFASARLFPATVDRMCTGDPPSPQGEGKGKSVFLAGRFLLCAVFGSPLRTPVRRIGLPLEGKVSAEPTDEVFIQLQHLIIVSLFIFRHPTGGKQNEYQHFHRSG